jgi:hypothetical protein
MSRLIDKFNRASQGATTPMGFHTSHPPAKTPKILLIASLDAVTAENPDACRDSVDAVLIRFDKSTLSAKAIQKITSSLPDIPLGLYLADNDNKKVAEVGADFVVFSATSQVVDIPGDEKAGKILEVESSMDDGLLRAVNDLPVDAVLVGDAFQDNRSLVWHQLMILQHLANILRKPLIVQVPASINEKELKALWYAGVDAIVVEIDATGAKGLKELRQAIDKLPPRSNRKRGNVDVLLPRTSGETPAVPPPDEEDIISFL